MSDLLIKAMEFLDKQNKLKKGDVDEQIINDVMGTPESLTKVLRRDVLELYFETREAVKEKIASGDYKLGDLVRFADRLLHWLRVIDEKPTDVTKHWLEQIHEEIGEEGIYFEDGEEKPAKQELH